VKREIIPQIDAKRTAEKDKKPLLKPLFCKHLSSPKNHCKQRHFVSNAVILAGTQKPQENHFL
jgi:hypothetical protein